MADKENFYEILGVTQENTEKEITKAYRKKALKCHPDKNPDNPKAADLFHLLSKALEVLTDPKAKAAYDAVLKAKERAKLRTQALDTKRKRFKQDLEERENASKSVREDDEFAAQRLQEEIKRLREEGSKLLEEQQQLLKEDLKRQQFENQIENPANDGLVTPKLKVKWKHKNPEGYSHELLLNLFSEYGEVTNVIISGKKKGSAIVEFKLTHAAQEAVDTEKGLPTNPLKISWLEGQNSEIGGTDKLTPETISEPVSEGSTITGKDYESITLMRMRQAQERQRIIREMMKDEES